MKKRTILIVGLIALLLSGMVLAGCSSAPCHSRGGSGCHMTECKKETLAVVQADTIVNFQDATVVIPDFEEFLQSKGFVNKANLIVESITESSKVVPQRETAYRAEIHRHNSYGAALKH